MNRHFLFLLANQLFTRVAYNLVIFTLLIWVFQLTESNAAVALWMVMYFTASVSFSLIAGVAADLFDRRKIMFFSNLVWGFLVLGFIAAKNIFPLILIFTFAAQALDEFFIPSQGSSLPQLVKDRHLPAANSYFFTTTYAATFIGFLLSGSMFRFFGFAAPFYLASALAILGALFTLFLPPLPVVASLSVREFFKQLKGRLVGQLDFLFHNQKVAVNVILMAFVFSGSTAVGAIAPGFSEQVLRIDARDLSFVGVLPIGLGFLTGAVVFSKWIRLWRVWQGILGFGAIVFLLAVSPTLRVFLAHHVATPQAFERFPLFSLAVSTLVFLLGFLAATVILPIVTSLQRVTPIRNLGRTFGSIITLAAILTTVEVLTFGVISDLFSPTVPVIFVGVLAILVALWIRSQAQLGL